MGDRAGDTGQGKQGDEGQDSRGEGKWAEMRDREGGGAGAAPPPGLQNSSGTVPTCSSPALTPFSLPGASGFPCCSKASVDIMETQ